MLIKSNYLEFWYSFIIDWEGFRHVDMTGSIDEIIRFTCAVQKPGQILFIKSESLHCNIIDFVD